MVHVLRRMGQTGTSAAHEHRSIEKRYPERSRRVAFFCARRTETGNDLESPAPSEAEGRATPLCMSSRSGESQPLIARPRPVGGAAISSFKTYHRQTQSLPSSISSTFFCTLIRHSSLMRTYSFSFSIASEGRRSFE